MCHFCISTKKIWEFWLLCILVGTCIVYIERMGESRFAVVSTQTRSLFLYCYLLIIVLSSIRTAVNLLLPHPVYVCIYFHWFLNVVLICNLMFKDVNRFFHMIICHLYLFLAKCLLKAYVLFNLVGCFLLSCENWCLYIGYQSLIIYVWVFTFLFLFFLIKVSIPYDSVSVSGINPPLFLILNVVLSILGPLLFYIQFRMSAKFYPNLRLN